MNSSIDRTRRLLLTGGTVAVGTGLAALLMRWPAANASPTTRPVPGNPVTLVLFRDDGTRIGKRRVAPVIKTAAEWRKQLSSLEYHVLREAGTEQPFSGHYYKKPAKRGLYRCRGCGNALYDSATQFHSGTGWPSFWQPIAPENVTEHSDHRLGMTRTEIACTRCEGHLGHKFHDGPKPTGLRYCMDSVALRFVATG